MENEKVFYRNSNVLVTQSRIVVFSKTYALRSVSSVSMFVKHKTTTKFLSSVLLIMGLFALYNLYYLFGIILIVVAVALLFFIKDEFTIQISSNSGDNNVLMSKNKEYFKSVVDAINEAIIYRG